jgi:hypothetical protein
MITPLRFHGPQETDIGQEWHPTAGVSRRSLDVGDQVIGRVDGIDGEVCHAIELFVRANSTKGTALSEGLSGGDQQFRYGHLVSPRCLNTLKPVKSHELR